MPLAFVIPNSYHPYGHHGRGYGYGCHGMRPRHPHANSFNPFYTGQQPGYSYQPADAYRHFVLQHNPYCVDPYRRAEAAEEEARAALQNAIACEEQARRQRIEAERRAESIGQARARMYRARSRASVPIFTPRPQPSSSTRLAAERQTASENIGFEDAEAILEAAFKELLQTLGAVASSTQPETSQAQQDKQEGAGNLKRKVRFAPGTESTSARSESTHNSSEESVIDGLNLHEFSELRKSALEQIRDLSARFDSLKDAFTLPTALDFNFTLSDAIPSLAYTPINAPVHSHNESLLLILQSLDAIDSNGDLHVRGARRELVRAVEAELEGVESAVRELWYAQETSKGKESVKDGIVKVVVRDAGETETPVEPAAGQSQTVDLDEPLPMAVDERAQPKLPITEPHGVDAEMQPSSDRLDELDISKMADPTNTASPGTIATNDTTLADDLGNISVQGVASESAEALENLEEEQTIPMQTDLESHASDIPDTENANNVTPVQNDEPDQTQPTEEAAPTAAPTDEDITTPSADSNEIANSLLKELDIIQEIVSSRSDDIGGASTVEEASHAGTKSSSDVYAAEAALKTAIGEERDEGEEIHSLLADASTIDETSQTDEIDEFVDMARYAVVKTEVDHKGNRASSSDSEEDGDVEFVVV